MNLDRVPEKIRRAHEKTGGRYTFYLEETGEQKAGLIHWVRPHPWAYESVGLSVCGDVTDCMAALDRYIAEKTQPAIVAAE